MDIISAKKKSNLIPDSIINRQLMLSIQMSILTRLDSPTKA